MKQLCVFHGKADAGVARRLVRALRQIKLPRALKQRFNLNSRRPFARTHIGPPRNDEALVLVISRYDADLACLDYAKRRSDAIIAYAADRSRGQGQRFAIAEDVLAVDLAQNADGIRLGALKIASRVLAIPLGTLRDREHDRQRRQLRFNLFATVGLGLALVGLIGLNFELNAATEAATETIKGVTLVSYDHLRDLDRYAFVPGPAAQTALDAMRRTITALDADLTAAAAYDEANRDAAPAVSIWARVMLANDLRARGRFDEAVYELQEGQALTMHPGFDARRLVGVDFNHETADLIGQTYELAGEFERAIAAYRANVARETRTGDALTRNIRLASSLTHLLRAKASAGVAPQTWPTPELIAARNAVAAIGDGPLPAGVVGVVTLDAPHTRTELRLALSAELEIAAARLAALTHNAAIARDMRARWRIAVGALESAQGPHDELHALVTSMTGAAPAPNIDALRQQASAAPYDGRLLEALATALARNALADAQTYDAASAQQAESILTNLTRLDATNLRYVADLADLYASASRRFAALGRCDVATALNQQALPLYDRVISAQHLSAAVKSRRETAAALRCGAPK